MLCIHIVFIGMFYQEQMSSRGHREETQSLKKGSDGHPRARTALMSDASA